MLPITNIRTFDKGEILLNKGDLPKYAYKVIKGCLRSYIIDKAGKLHILQFAPEDWFISDMEAFMNNQPATIFIDAIEKSEVMLFNRQMMEGFNEVGPAELIQQRQSLTKNIISLHKRVAQLLASTSEERYLDFIKTYPTLFKRLPLKLIASYLGIAPEYLSEIRKKIAKR